MKKKSLLLFICTALCICGCRTKEYSVVPFTEEDGTRVEQDDRGDTYYLESLPRTIVYDDKEIILNSISFYEDKVDHAYAFYALVDFDMSNLTDDDIYWMQEDGDLDVSIHITDEENEFDFKDFSFLRKIHLSDGTYRFAFTLRDKYRYSLSNKSCSLIVYMTQGGKYEYKSDDGEVSELDKCDTYYYFGCPIPEQLDTSDSIDEFTYNAMLEGFQNQLEFYKNMYNNLD